MELSDHRGQSDCGRCVISNTIFLNDWQKSSEIKLNYFRKWTERCVAVKSNSWKCLLAASIEPVHTEDVTPRDERVSKWLIWVALRDNSWLAVSGERVPWHPKLTWLVLLFLLCSRTLCVTCWLTHSSDLLLPRKLNWLLFACSSNTMEEWTETLQHSSECSHPDSHSLSVVHDGSVVVARAQVVCVKLCKVSLRSCTDQIRTHIFQHVHLDLQLFSAIIKSRTNES